MIRRAILVAAAAVAVILVPSVAMAYNAPGFSSSVSDATPAVGQSVTVVINGGAANANQVITLTVAGASTKTLTATANASGAATFTFTLSAAGVYTLTATNASGAVISTQTVTVHAVSAAAAPATGGLAFTGFEGTGLAVGGGLLVLTGAGVVLVARRRKSAQVPA
jgi:hypothetical protein